MTNRTRRPQPGRLCHTEAVAQPALPPLTSGSFRSIIIAVRIPVRFYCVAMFALLVPVLRPAPREPHMASSEVAGAVTCPGAFQVDGLTVSQTATVFQNSTVESSAGTCTIRRKSGGSIRMHAGSGLVVTPSGIQLVHGAIETIGGVSLTIAGAKSTIVPSPDNTTVQAQLANNQLLVNVSSGSAALTGRSSEIYARLDAGTLLRAAAAPSEPSGLNVWMRGCLTREGDRWFLADRYTKRRVELLNESVQKDGAAVGLWGSPQAIGKAGDPLAARLRVVSEKSDEGGCQKFSPAYLNNNPQPGPGSRTLIETATVPGQSGKPVSLP